MLPGGHFKFKSQRDVEEEELFFFFLKSTIQRVEADSMNRSEIYNFSKAICLNGDPTKPAWTLTCDHCSLKSELHILCAF